MLRRRRRTSWKEVTIGSSSAGGGETLSQEVEVGVHFNVVVAHLLIRVLGALCSDLVLPLNRIVINRIKTFVVFVRIRGILWLVVVCC